MGKEMISSNVVIPEGTTVIKGGEFEGRSDLGLIVIPDSVTVIEERAFYCCPNLQIERLPQNLREIGAHAFYCCRNLQIKKLPKNLRVIGDLAFGYCTGIKKLQLPEGLEVLGINPFLGCNIKMTSKSKRFKIMHDFLIEGGNSIVACLNDIVDVIIPDDIQFIKASAFQGRTSMRRLIMQPFMISIGCCAFQRCTDLDFIVMPEYLNEIGEWAFSECAMRRVDLPCDIKRIGGAAFYACENLETISVDKDMDMHHIGPAVFANCYNFENIYVRIEEGGVRTRTDSMYYLRRKFLVEK